jgi:hypothetical protein
MIALAVVALLAVALVVAIVTKAWPPQPTERLAWALRVLGFGATLAPLVVLAPSAIEENGSVAAYPLGVFLVLSVLPFALRRGSGRGAVAWGSALAFTAWAMLLGLSDGMFFLPAAVLLVLAAAVETGLHARPTAG